jgi:DNA-binding beta-propeller fold protein YncE
MIGIRVDSLSCFANIRQMVDLYLTGRSGSSDADSRIVNPGFLLLAFCVLLGLTPASAARTRETTLIVPPFSHDFGMHRASKFYLDMYLGQSFKFDDPEGLAAEKLAIDDDPKTSSDDHILTLFGVNSGSGQIVYNTGMKKLGVYGRSGSGERELNHPHGIAVDRKGRVYVADTDNNRVVHLRCDSSGLVFIRTIPGFDHPYDVALDSRGLVYVTDAGNSQVVVLDSFDRVKSRWPGFVNPAGILVIDNDAKHNFCNEEFVAVIDNNGQRLSRFSPRGELQASIEARDIGLAKAEFSYCALDYYSSIYVTDRLNDQVHKFDRGLVYLSSYGRSGSSEGEFNSPRGIAIGRQFGQVFIAEAEGGQYYWIGLDGYFIGCFPPVMNRDQPGTTIALYSTDMVDLTIDVYDQKSKIVRNLYAALNREKAGEMLVVWDGRDNAGKSVPPGEYTVQAILKPTYGGSRRVFKKELTAKVKRI